MGAARRPRIAAALALIAAAAPARARADDAPITIEVQGSSAPSFTSKAKEGDRPRDVPDAAALLEGLPGLRVRRLGAASSFATLSIRGAASNQIAVNLAGVPLTGAADPSLDLATLPLWPGASARAHRTFAPAWLGGGYLGGIVEIKPIELSSRPRTEVYDALGSFGAYRLRIADARPLGASWRIATGLSASRTDGDFLYWDPHAERDVRRTNAASAQVAGLVQARHDGDAWTVIATALATTRRDGVAGSFERPSIGTRLFRDRQLAAIEARRGDDDGRFLVRGWARRDGRTFEDPLGEQALLAGTTFDRVLAAGWSLGRSFRLGPALVLDARLDESIEASSGLRLYGPSPVRERVRFGASLDATWRVSDVLSVVSAARADLRNDQGEGAPGQREVLPAAHLGFERTFGAHLALAGHAGLVSRPPSFLELLGDGGVYTPNPRLASERAMAGDLGVRAAFGRRVRFELEAVGFASRVRDLIVISPVGLRSLRAENVGDALVIGGEVSLAATAGPVRAIASYTRLHTEDRTSNVSASGAPLPGRPAHDLTLDASITVGPAILRYGLDVVSSTNLDRAGLRVLPTRVFHGVGAKVTVSRTMTALLEIANLFDQRTVDVLYDSGSLRPFARYPTSDFLGYPLPGRRWTFALRWTI